MVAVIWVLASVSSVSHDPWAVGLLGFCGFNVRVVMACSRSGVAMVLSFLPSWLMVSTFTR